MISSRIGIEVIGSRIGTISEIEIFRDMQGDRDFQRDKELLRYAAG